MVKRRKLIQIGFSILTNGYLVGFLHGKIYQGPGKQVCLPGLNCYSCPGALGSCPIGALQAVVNDKQYSFSFYTVGFLMMTGTLLGKFVCGWLCPFGLFQDLLHKIPVTGKKRIIPGDKYLKSLKYIILVIFVLLLPTVIVNQFDQGDPWFCKYICPSGTLMAGWPLFIANQEIQNSIGILFGWKTLILLGLIGLSLWIYRPFCRWLCPLGAIYGMFNKFSIYRHEIKKDVCQSCGTCNQVCQLNLNPSVKPNGMECIRCGECISHCPQNAIQRKSLLQEVKKEEIHG